MLCSGGRCTVCCAVVGVLCVVQWLVYCVLCSGGRCTVCCAVVGVLCVVQW